MLLSFIIPLYNHLNQSKEMLISLLDTIPNYLDYEIFMIDDESIDGTKEWLNHIEDNRVHIITNKKNLGYAKSNNIAAKYAKGNVLALLNNDLVLLKGWLEPMLALLHSATLQPGIIGNVQYRVVDNTIDHVGISVNHHGKVEHIQTIEDITTQFKPVFAVTGACCLVFRDDFLKVGGFDETYVNGGEDVDLCLKLRALGKYAYVATTSHVKHHVSLSRDRTSLVNERNSQRLFLKWQHVFIQEIKNAWLTLLTATESRPNASLVDFNLQPEIMASTPHVVSLIAAKSVFLREQYRWQRLFDQNSMAITPFCVTTFSGACWENNSPYPWVDRCLYFVLPQGETADHVFISGKLQDVFANKANQHIEYDVIVEINGLQKKVWKNMPIGHFNLLMDNMFILPEHQTMFSIEVQCREQHGKPVCNQAWKAFTIAHIVMNDQIVLDLHRSVN